MFFDELVISAIFFGVLTILIVVAAWCQEREDRN
jgi:hypothetical protein